jgi:hypothetical protein
MIEGGVVDQVPFRHWSVREGDISCLSSSYTQLGVTINNNHRDSG